MNIVDGYKEAERRLNGDSKKSDIILFHGGCHGCTRQNQADKGGILQCHDCKYFDFKHHGLPDLNNKPKPPEKTPEEKRIEYQESVKYEKMRNIREAFRLELKAKIRQEAKKSVPNLELNQGSTPINDAIFNDDMDILLNKANFLDPLQMYEAEDWRDVYEDSDKNQAVKNELELMKGLSVIDKNERLELDFKKSKDVFHVSRDSSIPGDRSGYIWEGADGNRYFKCDKTSQIVRTDKKHELEPIKIKHHLKYFLGYLVAFLIVPPLCVLVIIDQSFRFLKNCITQRT